MKWNFTKAGPSTMSQLGPRCETKLEASWPKTAQGGSGRIELRTQYAQLVALGVPCRVLGSSRNSRVYGDARRRNPEGPRPAITGHSQVSARIPESRHSIQTIATMGFSTPEDAVRALEAAYVSRDIEAAVSAKNFEEEARLMLQKINSQFAADLDLLAETARVLELAFRAQVRDSGFPDFGSVQSTFLSRRDLTPTLVELTEEFLFADGARSLEKVYAFLGASG